MIGVKKCQVCGRRATMFLTQIVNGQVSELALCEHCAKEKGLFDPQSLTFAEKFFPKEFKKQIDKLVRELAEHDGESPAPAPAPRSGDTLLTCPACGFPLETYRKTGRLGCPDCYTVFARELETEPGNAEDAEEQDAPESPETLQQQLEEAVAREDYETAAALRDRIKELTRA